MHDEVVAVLQIVHEQVLYCSFLLDRDGVLRNGKWQMEQRIPGIIFDLVGRIQHKQICADLYTIYCGVVFVVEPGQLHELFYQSVLASVAFSHHHAFFQPTAHLFKFGLGLLEQMVSSLLVG